jgi:precorrin-2 dehydrogenase / sirohydrochlorin ferrochelatase
VVTHRRRRIAGGYGRRLARPTCHRGNVTTVPRAWVTGCGHRPRVTLGVRTVVCIERCRDPLGRADYAAMTSTTAPRFSFPVSLDVTGRRCVVAGGGPLAEEKAHALRQAGAEVVEVAAGGFSTDLLDGAFLLIISGEDDLDAATTFAEAERRGVLTNALDDIPHCHFAFPSLVRRGALQVAISTGGKAPALARRTRLDLEERLPASLGALVEAYADARQAALPREVAFDVWAAAWQRALEDLDGLLALCDERRIDEARDRILATVRDGIAAAPIGGPA